MVPSLIAAGVGAVAGAAQGIIGSVKAKKEEKKLNELIKNRPKYNISKQYGSNQAISGSQRAYAQNQLMGEDKVTQMANQEVDINAANSVNSATQSSNSSGGILAAITGINQNSNAAKRENAMDAASRLQNKQAMAMNADGTVMNANTAMAEEEDKAWNYNVNDPYQLNVGMSRDKIQNFRSNSNAGFSSMMSSIQSVAGGIGGGKKRPA